MFTLLSFDLITNHNLDFEATISLHPKPKDKCQKQMFGVHGSDKYE